MPEPQGDPFADFRSARLSSTSDLVRVIRRKIVESRIDCDGRHGRLILVESRSLRRTIRRYASARASITEADSLFAALAYLPVDASSLIPAGSDSRNPLHRSRLERTLGIREEAERWTTIHAARLMAIVDEASRFCRGTSDWVLEGVDWARIAEILAVPADHRICGLIAVSGAGFSFEQESKAHLSTLPIDLDGFGGGFLRCEPDTGGAPDRAL